MPGFVLLLQYHTPCFSAWLLRDEASFAQIDVLRTSWKAQPIFLIDCLVVLSVVCVFCTSSK